MIVPNKDNKHMQSPDQLSSLSIQHDERDEIIASILKEFPYYTLRQVEEAFEKCCKHVPPHREIRPGGQAFF